MMFGWASMRRRFASDRRTTQTVATRSSGQVAAASTCLRWVARMAAPRSPNVFQHSDEDANGEPRVDDADVRRAVRVDGPGRELEGAGPGGRARQAEDVLLDAEVAGVDRAPRLVERA